MEDLNAALPYICGAPKDIGPIDMLCFRPGFGEREMRNSLEFTVAQGIPGERWMKSPWMRLPDGSPDPRIQVSVLSKRVAETVIPDMENSLHPGDPIIADMDLSEANMPVGTRLQAGTAVIEVTDAYNEACVKWKTRYGSDAKDWIVVPENRPLRLRGILCRIVQDGVVQATDSLVKL